MAPAGGHGAERAEAKKVFDAYVEAGGNFIDTADSYQFGESEELVGDFITADRDYFARLVHTEKTARETAILDAVLAVAKEVGASPTEVAIAWLSHKAAQSPTSLIPVLGSRTREQLTGTLSALNVTLSQLQITRLDDVSAIPLGTPHEQIQGSAAAIAGGKPELLDQSSIPAA